MCGSEVERKKIQQEFNTGIISVHVTYHLQCGSDR